MGFDAQSFVVGLRLVLRTSFTLSSLCYEDLRLGLAAADPERQEEEGK